MKGGRDMKKIYKFEEQKEKYVIMNDKDEVFIINKENLKIDGNKFKEILIPSLIPLINASYIFIFL